MPRYYCDYCDTYLTHDSPSVRKQHNAGYKHKANVRSYYQQFEEQQTQSLIDQKVKEHLGQAAFQQVGAAFHQHMTGLQSGPYRPPISVPVLPPPLPVPGSMPGGAAPIRPPVLARPPVSSPGYGALPTVRPLSVESNGLPVPQTLTPPGAPGVRPATSYMSTNGSIPSNGSFGSYPGNPAAGYSQQGSQLQYSTQQPGRAVAPLSSSGQTTLGYSQNPIAPPGANHSTSSYTLAATGGAGSGYGN